MKFSLSANLLKKDNCLLSQRNRYQFLVTVLINLITLAHGIGIGWMSPVMRNLQTEQTPLSFDVSVSEVSWIGSLMGIGSIAGNLFAGLLQDRIGRKLVMYAIAIPNTCFWILVYCVQSVEYLYIGRFLAGFTGGGAYIVLPIFVSEIADTNIRGALCAMVMLAVNLGVLTGYIISTNVAYFTAPLFTIALPISYFILNMLFPETPTRLIRKGKLAAAEQSFRYYKNIGKSNDTDALMEFEDLKQKINKELATKNNPLSYKDFVTRPVLRAYGTAMALLVGNQFSGLFCFVSYLTDVFDKSHTTLDINMCTIVIGVVQIVAVYTTTLLSDRYGRKILLLISTLGTSACLAVYGCYTYFAEQYDLTIVGWLPLLLLSFVVFLGHIGLVGCLFVVLVELFPSKIRSVAVTFFTICLSSLVFVTLKIFPICLDQWGISVTLWCCSAITLLIFTHFCYFLEETNGKSLIETEI